MKIDIKLALMTFISFYLSGCTIPGSDLNVENKIIVETSKNTTRSEKINVYSLTAKNVSEFGGEQVSLSRPNPWLDTQISQYEYHIGIGDVLDITIWDHPELTIPAGSYRSAEESGNWVGADGTIFYPYVGMVHVAGKTVSHIRDEIAHRLKKYIESPQVDVHVAAFRSQKTYVTGEVKQPGKQAISNIPMTILDAINASGGLSSDADWRNITLTRDGSIEHISLYALIQKGDLTQNRLLQPGDILHVPRNDAQKIFVMGQVNRPQILKIGREGMTLTEAIGSVGGIDELTADATGIFVIRSAMNKTESLADVYQLDMTDASSLAIGTEFHLKPYDVIYVTAVPLSRWNRVINELMPTIDEVHSLTESTNTIHNW